MMGPSDKLSAHARWALHSHIAYRQNIAVDCPVAETCKAALLRRKFPDQMPRNSLSLSKFDLEPDPKPTTLLSLGIRVRKPRET